MCDALCERREVGSEKRENGKTYKAAVIANPVIACMPFFASRNMAYEAIF